MEYSWRFCNGNRIVWLYSQMHPCLPYFLPYCCLSKKFHAFACLRILLGLISTWFVLIELAWDLLFVGSLLPIGAKEIFKCPLPFWMFLKCLVETCLYGVAALMWESLSHFINLCMSTEGWSMCRLTKSSKAGMFKLHELIYVNQAYLIIKLTCENWIALIACKFILRSSENLILDSIYL